MTQVGVPQGEQIHVDLDPTATLAAYARHRRRFATEVSELDERALATRSRCTQWTVADVLRHCCDVDEWMRTIWAGEAPPFRDFDPVTTPHEFVIAGRSTPDVEVRDRYVESCEIMAADVGSSGPERWGLGSVSPVGFVPWWLSALHVFFDSWLHERDVFVPLEIATPVDPTEVIPVFAYSLALAGTLIAESSDSVIAGARLVTGERPVVAAPVRSGAVDADGIVAMIEALSGRGSVEDAFTSVDADTVRRLGALGRLLQPPAERVVQESRSRLST